MSIQQRGFTLLEIVLVLGITAILALGVLPDLNTYVAKQELKLAASTLTTYIQSARNYSATTECKSSVTFKPTGNTTQVTVQLSKDEQWRGCKRWFEASGKNPTVDSVTISTGLVEHALLANEVTIQFNGVSGNMASNNTTILNISNQRAKGTIELSGIGNGVFNYVN